MNKSMKSLVATSVLAGLMASGAAMADMSANIGATSNYVWRGITQSADGAAVSGGLDYSHSSGIYVGTWTSSTAWGSAEDDLYGGYAHDFGPVSVDVGVTRFFYPTIPGDASVGADNGINWTEYTAKVGFGPATLMYGHGSHVFGNMGVNSNYAGLDLSHDLKEDLSIGLHVGYWKFSEALNSGWVTADPVTEAYAKKSFTEYGVSLTKGEFTFTVSDSSLKKQDYQMDGQFRMYASWTKSFDL